jgi:hypothetical protein
MKPYTPRSDAELEALKTIIETNNREKGSKAYKVRRKKAIFIEDGYPAVKFPERNGMPIPRQE